VRALPLALLACCLLAGCAALPAGPPRDAPETGVDETVTPAPVPDKDVPDVLPGVGDDGANESARFRAVNRERLGDGSLRAQLVHQVEGPDGGLLARSTEVNRIANESTMLLRYERNRRGVDEYGVVDAEVWVGPERAFRRLVRKNGEERLERRPEPGRIRELVRPNAGAMVEALLSTDLRFDERTTVDGRPRYVLTGERETVPEVVRRVGTEANRDVRVTARFDEAGVLRVLRVEWRGEYQNQTVTATFVARFDQFGEATAPRPAWVDRFPTSTPGDDSATSTPADGTPASETATRTAT
jgi:hypothetical protein